ncbi:GerMN domain-containing protein [Streptomyces sp. SID14515]|uniref:GerMN domain-containing protein n=1 Tax=Streptomyces sp. SID14515 TaxID=2706074 RepID=UPI0013CDC60B|nr:GerMN domain-containing protein [Streptomyces sp. SID14515]NEB41802.1 GerMN domain-containing protein [Streptomyces sp. SID14515]
MRRRQGVVLTVLGAALVGCGVQPTGVIDAGEPASGLTRGMRLYFASDTGLRAVPLLDRDIRELGAALKLLAQGPTAAERREGLTTLVHAPGGYSVTGDGTRVTVELDGPYWSEAGDRATGQLVCTLAGFQSVREADVRADDVEVTIRPGEGPVLGPLGCAEFLDR